MIQGGSSHSWALEAMRFSGLRRAWTWYQSQLTANPLRTQVISSGLIWSAGDLIGQKVNVYTTKHLQASSSSDEGLGENNEKERLDLRRTATCALFGLAFVGPVGHYWYLGLDFFVKQHLKFRRNSLRFILAKLIPDGLLSPVHLCVFYSFVGLSAGKSLDTIVNDVKRDMLPALMADTAIWPVLQTINFRFVPVRHQLLYVNTVSVVDSAFLSWFNKEGDATWKQQLLRIIGLGKSQETGF